MRAIKGVVQHYRWGDASAIPRLLGHEPDGRPWAELWFGTHHAGPATFADGSPLRDATGDLPYLVKVLAAAEPLSLQTHPDEVTAADGFADEQRRGVALTDPTRLYRDPHAKPELLCALTPFTALCGFRPQAASVALLRRIGADAMADSVEHAGLAATVESLYRGRLATAPAVQACRDSALPEARLATELDRLHPGDPSVAVALLLHLVDLTPGEALYLTPGNLHAYVRGVGIEVMGPSDNVLRGGLTPKHVDVDALLGVMRTGPVSDPVVRPIAEGGGVWAYPTPGAPFRVRRLELDGQAAFTADGHEVLVCTAGEAAPLRAGAAVHLAPGEQVELHGTATVFRVSPA